MTVIAWDGYVLGADRRTSMHNSECQKLFQLEDRTWFAFAGDCCQAMKIKDWLESRERFRDREVVKDVYVLHIKEDGTAESWCGEMSGPGAPVLNPPFAMGSGREYAMGAMGFGATVREAIEIACRYDSGCGGEPDIEEVPTFPGFVRVQETA